MRPTNALHTDPAPVLGFYVGAHRRRAGDAEQSRRAP